MISLKPERNHRKLPRPSAAARGIQLLNPGLEIISKGPRPKLTRGSRRLVRARASRTSNEAASPARATPPGRRTHVSASTNPTRGQAKPNRRRLEKRRTLPANQSRRPARSGQLSQRSLMPKVPSATNRTGRRLRPVHRRTRMPETAANTQRRLAPMPPQRLPVAIRPVPQVRTTARPGR
jgi:hypothetical protein